MEIEDLEIVRVTPTVAADLLKRNTHNRPLRDQIINLYAREMREGRWRESTAETIKISREGTLLDGQNRLQAVVKSGCAVNFLVAKNLDENIFDVIDTGLKRQASDALYLKGIKHPTLVASIIRFRIANHGNGGSTTRMVKEFYENEPAFWEDCTERSIVWHKEFNPLASSWFGGLYAICQKVTKYIDKVIPFFNSVATGEECSPAALELRKKLINESNSRRKLKTADKYILFLRYWNAHLRGTKSVSSKSTETEWL